MAATAPAERPAEAVPASARHRLFEPVALVLLSLATVGTAWCSYQAAAWGAAAQGAVNRANIAGRNAVTQQLQSSQLAVLDVLLFSQYVNARAGSNEPLARFYAERFRGEARTAFDRWLASKPFENPSAPPHPFVTNLYQPRLLEAAAESEAATSREFTAAGEAGRTSRAYILVTVVLASALFCGGIASKFDVAWIRRAVLAMGMAAFLSAAVRLMLLPVQF
jgi:hypothetical protein